MYISKDGKPLVPWLQALAFRDSKDMEQWASASTVSELIWTLYKYGVRVMSVELVGCQRPNADWVKAIQASGSGVAVNGIPQLSGSSGGQEQQWESRMGIAGLFE